MPKLTDSSIKAAACPADKHRMELSDTACPGLILRVTRAGSKSFLFKYWSPLLSKSVSLTLGSYPALDLAGARDRIADHRKLIAKDKDLPADRHTALGLKFILTTMVRPYQSAYADVSELLNLDGTDPEYHLPPKRVKRRRPVIVPLSELACEVLDEALEDKDQVVVFPSRMGDGDIPIRRDALAQARNGKKAENRTNG